MVLVVGFVIFFTALVLCSCGSYGFVLWFVSLWCRWMCLCVRGVLFFLVCICVINCGGPVWADLWCVYYMWFGLWFGWLAESGCLCAFDLVEFVYYNLIIIYCYLCYK